MTSRTPSNPEQRRDCKLTKSDCAEAGCKGHVYLWCSKCDQWRKHTAEFCIFHPAPTEGVEPVSEVEKILFDLAADTILAAQMRTGDTGVDKARAAIERLIAEARERAYDEGIDEAKKHLYTASQINQALSRVLGSKAEPKLVKAVIEDVGESLAELNQMKGKTV